MLVPFLLTNILLQLADLITATTLTDKGPYNPNQFSRLWSSCSEFQMTRAPHLRLEINPIALPEVERSIDIVLHAQSMSLPPASLPSVSMPVVHLSLPAMSARSSSLMSSSFHPGQSANLSHPTASVPCSKPIRAWVTKALDIITKVEEQTREVYTTLVLPEDFDLGNLTQVTQMRVLLQLATERIDSRGKSLKLI